MKSRVNEWKKQQKREEWLKVSVKRKIMAFRMRQTDLVAEVNLPNKIINYFLKYYY